jgi:hypothetical protein
MKSDVATLDYSLLVGEAERERRRAPRPLSACVAASESSETGLDPIAAAL